jgi:uncharacterized protein (DUF488 family)
MWTKTRRRKIIAGPTPLEINLPCFFMLFTIGHSNHSLDYFIELLHSYDITAVADVRSAPYSRYVMHFNKGEIEQTLRREGIRYIFMGDIIGGKPSDRSLYAPDGTVQYDALARLPTFQVGLDRLLKGLADGWRIGIMCAEEDPGKCHRHLLIAREMERDRKIPVWHIRADNTLVRAGKLLNTPSQRQLF